MNLKDVIRCINDKCLSQEESELVERLHACYSREKTLSNLKKKIYYHDDYLAKKMQMGDGSTLSSAQLKQVNEYWARYAFAYKNNPRIQESYTVSSEIFSPKYMSEGLQWWFMWRFTEDLKYRDSFHDKNYFDLILPRVKHPTPIIRKIKKSYYSADRKLITLDKAAQSCYDFANINTAGKIIVKPSAGGGGYGIQFIRKGDDIGKIKKILSEYDELIVEDILKAHPNYEVFHPHSLNTLRIVSLWYNEEVTIVSSLLRTGRNKSEIDNYSQGGVSVGIYPNGVLHDYGFDMHCNKYYTHPDSGVSFKDYKLHGYGKVVNEIKKLHPQIPQFKHVSWDFAVDEDGTPILMEFNTRGDITIIQQNGDLPYGKYTDEIFDDWLLFSYYESHSTMEYDYKESPDKIVLQKCYIKRDEIIVPHSFNGKPVKGILSGCFEKCGAKKIVLPNEIGYIEKNSCPNDTDMIFPKDFISRPQITMARINTSENCVNLEWTLVENADVYIIKRETDRKEEIIATVSKDNKSYKDFLFPKTASTCYYSVVAKNLKTNKESDVGRSGRVRLSYLNKVKIKKAGYLKLLKAAKVVWDKNPFVDQYIVTRICDGETEVLGTTSKDSFLDKKVEKGHAYIYEIFPNSLDSLCSARTTLIKCDE
ncbi:MAG: sugar-transfer associated ATP-grasp domain-containing protein [Christensenellales bacterium]|jgi:hypothetical protein